MPKLLRDAIPITKLDGGGIMARNVNNCNKTCILELMLLITIVIAIDLITPAKVGYSQEIKTFTYTDGGVYEGEAMDDKREGKGTMTWPDGTQYVGGFKDDLKSGQGTYTWSNGDKYEGEWKDDKINGKGALTLADGTKFVGEFIDGQKSGQGTYTWPNGDKYEGEWKGDERNGKGTMTWSDGRNYVGEWKQDKRNGMGTLSLPNGDIYEGELKDDKFDGKGTYTYADGRKYIGDFKDDKFIAGETIRSQAQENLIDKVAAVVNDDVITLSEVKDTASVTNKNPDDTQVQRELLEMMIEERLLLQEAKKLGIQVTDSEVDAAIAEVKRRFNLTEDEMADVLKKQNYTPESFRDQWRRQILSNKLMGSRVQGQIAVTEDEVKKFYEENKGELKLSEEIRISQILIPVESPENEKQAENQALDVAKLAKSGEDFGMLAKQYSKDPSSADKGGDLGYFKKGEMAPDLEKILAETPVGEILGPVRAPTGFMIIKIVDKKAVELSSLDPDKAREEIREKLYQLKVAESLKVWLETVKKTAYIEKKI